MKTFVFLASLLVFTTASAVDVACMAIQGRTYADSLTVDSFLTLTLNVDDGKVTDATIAGVLKTAYGDYSVAELTTEDAYIALFDGSYVQTLNEKARKYKGYIHFADVDAKRTVGHEDGMWGYFVIEPDALEKAENEYGSFKAHYVFQAGDHIGGTIDYKCVGPKGYL